MFFDAYIFDLDGTVLDTLPDLVNITNTVLAEWDMPTHTTEEVNSYVGNGARMLLVRAAPEGTADDVIDALLARWRGIYPELGHQFTHPYAGIPETLAELKRGGALLGVLSNKFDAAAQSVIAEQFPDVFDLVRGECEEIPRKPDPAGLRYMMGQLGVQPSDVLYVGDSETDVKTAHCAGVACVAVSWGYRSRETLAAAGAATIIDNPSDLLLQ